MADESAQDSSRSDEGAQNPYWTPPVELAAPSPFTRVERHTMAKSRVYMLLFALGGYLLVGLLSLQAVLHVYWLVTWDAETYELLGLSASTLGLVVASRTAYAMVIGAMSYTLWNWAVTMRLAAQGQCEPREMSARQLSFWRAAAATAAIALIHVLAAAGYLGYLWNSREVGPDSPFDERDESSERKDWTAMQENAPCSRNLA